MPFWSSSNIQKRLLLYVLQKISLLSNIDTSNVDVSLGSSSKVDFHDVELMVDQIVVPTFKVEKGTVGELDILISMSGVIDIMAQNILVVCSPKSETMGTNGDFSLAKSIYDLTSSVFQLSESFNADEDDSSEEKEYSDGLENNSTDKSGESRSQDVQEGKFGAFNSMKSKILNNILAKFSISLKDFIIRIYLNDMDYIELKIDDISILNDGANIRQVTMSSILISSNCNVSGNDDIKQSSLIENSYMRDTLEDSMSMYMSALDTTEQLSVHDLIDKRPPKSDLSVLEILTIDIIQGELEGISSINDLSLSSLSFSVGKLVFNFDNLSKLENACLKKLMSMISNNSSVDTDLLTENTIAYKRFQTEQQLQEKTSDLKIQFTEIFLKLADTVEVVFYNIIFNKDKTNEANMTFDKVDTPTNGIDITTNDSNFFAIKKIRNETTVSVFQNCHISISESSLKQLIGISNQIKKVWSLYEEQNKRLKRTVHKNIPVINFESKNISLALITEKHQFVLEVDPIKYCSSKGLAEVNNVRFSILESDETESSAVRLEKIVIREHKCPVQIEKFNSNFDQTVMSLKNKISIDNVQILGNFELLKDLFLELQSLSVLFDTTKGRDSSSFQIQTSKKLRGAPFISNPSKSLSSSLIFQRKKASITTLVEILNLDLKLKKFWSPEFGQLIASSKKIMMTKNVDEDWSIVITSLQILRNFEDLNQILLETNDKILKKDVPVIFIEKKPNGQVATSAQNLCLHLHAKLLSLFENNNENAGSPMQSMKSNNQFPVDIKVKTSTLMIHPYRLNSVLLLIIDELNVFKSSMNNDYNIDLKRVKVFLIDDLRNRKQALHKAGASLALYYNSQGFTAIGQITKIGMTLVKKNMTFLLKIDVDVISLSLCADSFNTLIPSLVDLKIPLTFPDELKYNFEPDTPVTLFSNIDSNYFTQKTFNKEENATAKVRSSSIHIVNDFYDQYDNEQITEETNNIDAAINLTECQSQGQNNEEIAIDENYLDSKILKKPGKIFDSDENVIIDLQVTKFLIKLFDGYDWKYTRKSISDAIEYVGTEVEKTEVESEPNVALQAAVFSSVYISSTKTDAPDLKSKVSHDIQGDGTDVAYLTKVNLRPSRHYKVLIEASNLKLKFRGYPIDYFSSTLSCVPISKLHLVVDTFEIIDNVPTSTWGKFMGLQRHSNWPASAPMLTLSSSLYKPIKKLEAVDTVLSLKVAPLRLHVDQDTLDFMTRFFGFKDERFQLIDDYPEILFIQKLTINSIKIMLDYKPKNVDYSGIKSGQSNEFVNFFILDGAKLSLKDTVLYGINGLEELGVVLKDLWKPYVLSSQLGGIISGVSSIKPVIDVGSGLKKIITAPYKEYKQDKNLSRSLQTGVNVFCKTAGGDFIRLGAKMASGTQAILETTEEMFGGVGSAGRQYDMKKEFVDLKAIIESDQLLGANNPKIKNHKPAAIILDSTVLEDNGKPKVISLYADQPLDVHKGLEEAYSSLEKNFHLAYQTIVTNKDDTTISHQTAAMTAVSMAKAAPIAIIRPLIGATEAISKTLQGLSNQLDKDQVENQLDKYKQIR